MVDRFYNYKEFYNKEWNFSNAEQRLVYEYDGLAFAPSRYAKDTQVSVRNTSPKYYEGIEYNKALYLPGDGGTDKRSIVFKTDRPCVVTVYAYASSHSDGKISKLRLSSQLQKIFDEPLGDDGKLKKCVGYLPEAGKYYLNTSLKSAYIAYIKITPQSKGDLNGDGLCDFKDLNLLDDHLGGISTLESWQKDSADMNGDNAVDSADRKLLLDEIRSKPENIKERYTDKVWNFSEMFKDRPNFNIKEAQEFDGLTVYPKRENYGANLETTGDKVFENKIFSRSMFVRGGFEKYFDGSFARAFKFSTDAPCYVTVLFRNATTIDVDSFIVAHNINDEIARVPMLRADEQDNDGSELQRVDIYLAHADTYYIGSTSSVRVYYIKLTPEDEGHTNSDWDVETVSRDIKVNTDKSVEYIFTANQVPSIENAIFTMDYDEKMMSCEIVSIDADDVVKESVNLIRNKNGKLIFKLNRTEKDWAGIVVRIKVTGKATGTTKISLSAGRDIQIT